VESTLIDPTGKPILSRNDPQSHPRIVIRMKYQEAALYGVNLSLDLCANVDLEAKVSTTDQASA
jgi:hypothetical protein